ncbi:hypothetical protein LMG27177_07545 [Paraburkholderia fynbosensis]|uniref:Transposase n=1 Tax=Paraburkholderia fynbosensis TaxID=1200993 RepID=A0A6J5H5Q4_9BURK|nr:hypothetical protein LMG27177_07545 [Paraburkholderia fynbosensis]
MRWVQRFTPEFVKRGKRLAMKAAQSWRVEETYVKIRGKLTADKESCATRTNFVEPYG